jgi:hypothetical protein
VPYHFERFEIWISDICIYKIITNTW